MRDILRINGYYTHGVHTHTCISYMDILFGFYTLHQILIDFFYICVVLLLFTSCYEKTTKILKLKVQWISCLI